MRYPTHVQRLIFLQVAEKTRQEMNVTFSQRLSEIPTDSASMSKPQTTALTQSMTVEKIVYKSKLGYMERLSKANMDIKKSVHSTAMAKIQTISEVLKAILNVLTENRHDVIQTNERYLHETVPFWIIKSRVWRNQ